MYFRNSARLDTLVSGSPARTVVVRDVTMWSHNGTTNSPNEHTLAADLQRTVRDGRIDPVRIEQARILRTQWLQMHGAHIPLHVMDTECIECMCTYRWDAKHT